MTDAQRLAEIAKAFNKKDCDIYDMMDAIVIASSALARVEALERALEGIVRRADEIAVNFGPSDPPEAPEIAAARAALQKGGQ